MTPEEIQNVVEEMVIIGESVQRVIDITSKLKKVDGWPISSGLVQITAGQATIVHHLQNVKDIKLKSLGDDKS